MIYQTKKNKKTIYTVYISYWNTFDMLYNPKKHLINVNQIIN